MKPFNVVIYQTKSKKEPLFEWLEKLDLTTKSVILVRLNRIRLGNLGDIKKIVNAPGIWEFRIHYGPGYRIYLGKHKESWIILLNAGSKKTQDRDINKAKEYWLDYKDRL